MFTAYSYAPILPPVWKNRILRTQSTSAFEKGEQDCALAPAGPGGG